MDAGVGSQATFNSGSLIHLTSNMRYVGATTYDMLTVSMLDLTTIYSNTQNPIYSKLSFTDSYCTFTNIGTFTQAAFTSYGSPTSQQPL